AQRAEDAVARGQDLDLARTCGLDDGRGGGVDDGGDAARLGVKQGPGRHGGFLWGGGDGVKWQSSAAPAMRTQGKASGVSGCRVRFGWAHRGPARVRGGQAARRVPEGRGVWVKVAV